MPKIGDKSGGEAAKRGNTYPEQWLADAATCQMDATGGK